MADFEKGDAVWINDGYAGSPHPATVTGTGEEGLYAEGTKRLPRDSRVLAWTIRADAVAAMVAARV